MPFIILYVSLPTGYLTSVYTDTLTDPYNNCLPTFTSSPFDFVPQRARLIHYSTSFKNSQDSFFWFLTASSLISCVWKTRFLKKLMSLVIHTLQSVPISLRFLACVLFYCHPHLQTQVSLWTWWLSPPSPSPGSQYSPQSDDSWLHGVICLPKSAFPIPIPLLSTSSAFPKNAGYGSVSGPCSQTHISSDM